ncbi:hypothetical protein LNQ52_19225 [Klebsiella pneumoniae subsp. pneumoniae]|nr:hypothetical protein [Klebsiella pneumoniae subsp. pneumoniae]
MPDGVFGLSGRPFIPLGVGWRYAYPTYGSRHGELKIPMPGVGSRPTRPAFGDLSILLKIPAIKRGFPCAYPAGKGSLKTPLSIIEPSSC